MEKFVAFGIQQRGENNQRNYRNTEKRKSSVQKISKRTLDLKFLELLNDIF